MIETRKCECGAAVKVEIPEDMPPKMARLLRELSPVCELCSARDERQREAEEAAERARAVEARQRRRIVAAGIPSELRGLLWDTLDLKDREAVVRDARKWAAGDLRGLMLTGPIGVGKTRIAATAAWEYLNRSRLRWTSMPVLFARLAAGHNDEARQAAVQLLTGTEALVLEDLDKARPTEYGAEQVFAVIDNRITEGSPLLVTTNLSLNELVSKFPDPFGQAIASRLAGYCARHEVTGTDRRHRAAAA